MTNEDKIIDYIKSKGSEIGNEMGFTKLTELHSDWIRQAVFATEDWKIFAHRGSYKSTAVDIVGIALKMILFPSMNGRFFRKTDEKVKEVIRGISGALKTDIAKWLSKELWGTPVMLTVDNTVELSTNLYCKVGGSMQLTGHGFKTPITSAHADYILTDDICFIAGTQIATQFGKRSIELLKVGDKVITPFGLRKITAIKSRYAEVITNCGLTGTHNHPIFNKNNNSFDKLDTIQYNNCIKLSRKELYRWIKTKLLNGMGINGKRQESIISCWHLIQKEQDNNCIEPFGKNIMGKFPKAMIFIIKTLIAKIITLKIWIVYQVGNIIDCILCGWQKNIKTIRCLKMMKSKLFVKSAVKKALLNQQREKTKTILYVLSVIITSFIKNILKKRNGLEQKKESALFVEKNIIQLENHKYYAISMDNVEKSTVNYTNEKEKVYCIEVEDCGVYFANDILVKNCDLSDRLFKKERENTKTMYQELRNIINRDPWCCIGNTGTSWEKNDVEILMPEGQKITCYDSGLLTEVEIAELKKQMTPSLFAANYELKHIASDQQLFGEPQMLESNDQIYDGIGHLDAAYGGGDTTALTILNKRPDNSLVGYGKVYDKSVMLCIQNIAETFRKYRVKTIYCESNADKGYLARDLSTMGFNVITYHENQNKESKIGTYGLKSWHSTKWIPETDINYLGQIVDYQEGVGLDDCPDSYASLCRQIESGKAERIWV